MSRERKRARLFNQLAGLSFYDGRDDIPDAIYVKHLAILNRIIALLI